MSNIAFEVEWETGLPGNNSPEMRATFAHLSINVNSQLVTSCIVGEVIKKQILTPLYPLAEWFAFNWWRLMYEPYCPGRNISEADFLTRHGLLDARDGFALPDLRFLPEGDGIRLNWVRHQLIRQPLEFFKDGSSLLPRQQVMEAIFEFVEAVLERLANQGIRNSRLATEWRAIHETSPEEVQFCETAARLGLDPYDMMDEQSELILSKLDDLPTTLRDELVSAITVDRLHSITDWVEAAIDRPDLPQQGQDLDWHETKKSLHFGPQRTPWEEGYRLASSFRSYLNLPSDTPVELPDMSRLIVNASIPAETIDALLVVKPNSAPVCLTRGSSRLESKRFQFARSIGEYLALPPDTSTLLTRVRNRNQKRSRAFAAELLAPRAALESRLKSKTVSEEDAQELASEFQVSSWIIANQLKNHGLASVLSSPYEDSE